jgi:hypothetical protein
MWHGSAPGAIAQGVSTYVGTPLGAIMGGIGLINGLAGLDGDGDKSQAALDTASSGGAVAATMVEAAGLSCPPLAAAAAIAGLMASGNATAEKEGWYGSETDAEGREHNFSFGDSVADTYDDVNDAIDVPVIGELAGGAAAAGQALANGAVAAGAGVLDMSDKIVSGVLGLLGFDDGHVKPGTPEWEERMAFRNANDPQRIAAQSQKEQQQRRESLLADAEAELAEARCNHDDLAIANAQVKVAAMGGEPGRGLDEVRAERAEAAELDAVYNEMQADYHARIDAWQKKVMSQDPNSGVSAGPRPEFNSSMVTAEIARRHAAAAGP